MGMYPQSLIRDLKPYITLKEQNLSIFGEMPLECREASANMDERAYPKYETLRKLQHLRFCAIASPFGLRGLINQWFGKFPGENPT